MKDKNSSLRSVIISLLVAFNASLVVLLLWMTGVLASLESAFLLSRASEAVPAAAPERWLGTLMILAAGLSTGFAVERAGAKRALPFICGGLATLAGLSLLASRLLQIDIAFAPMALAALASALAVQLRRLRKIDSTLTTSIKRAASLPGKLEGGSSSARLMSGLRLLDTVLPLEEAVIFQPDENGHLALAARLRSATSGGPGSNSAWREGVSLCERAVESRAMVTQRVGGAEGVDENSAQSNVALPLRHEGRSVGALLVRLRERFDESDRPLLLAVGEQLARNFQRDEARKRGTQGSLFNLLSTHAAESRLEMFGVVSGLLTEQRFGAEVLSEASDGHAVAYLDGTLAYINPTLLKAARLIESEARSLDLFALLDRFRAGVFDEPSIAVRRVLQTGDAYERELHFPERNQTLELRIALVTERNGENGASAQPLCLAVTVRDVTRIKEYEKLKSDMISLMSHELRTPITSINGFAELLMNDEAIPVESREFLSIINSESQRLSRMINTFLAVTQLEAADKQEVLKIPLKLDDVVRETLASLQPVAKKKRIRLVEQPSSRLPPVAADRSLITQVVTNLVGNAIKYSPERTTVTVSTQLEADTVRLSVEDRGYGIPPEAVDRVWEKFYRVTRDGQEKDEESTGLGLSFVREVVEQHGGTVSLESEVGRGSKFSFTLPRL
ncbi:MAG: GAF domain-containing sensor histidine kinase [Acidobacteriota bacterium]|nr:GAF domain-containing sensor histidine kinase [Acidobacteriota bacterium]